MKKNPLIDELSFSEFIPSNWSDDELLFSEPINRPNDQEDYLFLFHQFISVYKPDLNTVWYSEIHHTFFPVYLTISRVTIFEVLTWIELLPPGAKLTVINITNSFIGEHIFLEPRAQVQFCKILEDLILFPLTQTQALLLYSEWALNLYYLEAVTPTKTHFILNRLETLL